MPSILEQLGAALLTLAAGELTTLKPTIVSQVDSGISNVNTQAKAAIDKGLTGHGALSLFAGALTTPINGAIDEATAAGETEVGPLIDAGIAALTAEAAKLEAVPVTATLASTARSSTVT